MVPILQQFLLLLVPFKPNLLPSLLKVLLSKQHRPLCQESQTLMPKNSRPNTRFRVTQDQKRHRLQSMFPRSHPKLLDWIRSHRVGAVCFMRAYDSLYSMVLAPTQDCIHGLFVALTTCDRRSDADYRALYHDSRRGRFPAVVTSTNGFLSQCPSEERSMD